MHHILFWLGFTALPIPVSWNLGDVKGMEWEGGKSRVGKGMNGMLQNLS